MSRLRRHQKHLATAAPVWHELVFGWNRVKASQRRDAIGRYLQEVVQTSVPILPYDAAAAAWHGAERARLADLGRTPPFVDGQIAAIAVLHGLVLVTANVSDFDGFRDLEVVDWRD